MSSWLIEAYKRLLDLYPDDPLGNHNLAVKYWRIGERSKAFEYYEINRKSGNMTLIGYSNLAGAYRDVGSYDKAREVLEEAIQKNPDKAEFRRNLARLYRNEGKFDLALAEIDKSFALEPDNIRNFTHRGPIYFYRDDLVKAAEDYRWLQKHTRPEARYYGSMGLVYLNLLQGKFRGSKELLRPVIAEQKKYGVNWTVSAMYLKFAYINLKTGDFQEALKDCDIAADYALKAEDPSSQRQALQRKGLTYVRMNALDEALKKADELKSLIQDSRNPNNKHYFQHLIGKIELKKKNFSRAVEDFKEALSLYSSDPRNKRADYVESLAMAYHASGDIDKAQAEYERIISLSVGRIYYGDVYALSFYALAKIYEQKGWKGKAIENYEKFLSLWKDADPGFTEVEDAKKKILTLKGN